MERIAEAQDALSIAMVPGRGQRHQALLVCFAKKNKVASLPQWLLSLAFNFREILIKKRRNVHYSVSTCTGKVKQEGFTSF